MSSVPQNARQTWLFFFFFFFYKHILMYHTVMMTCSMFKNLLEFDGDKKCHSPF